MKNISVKQVSDTKKQIAIIGAGPAGLMAAEVIARAGYPVHVYDAMPSAARKFLLAGIGGLNITHAEDFPLFITRYGKQIKELQPMLEAFGPVQLRSWIHDLGIETFVGSSGRVFPSEMKAAPLLRAWLHRLRASGVEFFMRHRCLGWNRQNQLCFATATGEIQKNYAAVVLAMGGGSWPQLGSDGVWQSWLGAQDVSITPLMPANCGFTVKWSSFLKEHHAGSPVKNVVLGFTDSDGRLWEKNGEFILSEYGIEGGAVYAVSAPLRDVLLMSESATMHVDLLPHHSQKQLQAILEQKRKGLSLGNLLRKRLKLSAAEVALVNECLAREILIDPVLLSQSIKKIPIKIESCRPLSEAISSAGGVAFNNLNSQLMVKHMPGVFCAGEMLDWEAPTGGYLLTACFATGYCAGGGVLDWLERLKSG